MECAGALPSLYSHSQLTMEHWALQQEYLELYPSIQFEVIEGKPILVVSDPSDGAYWRLERWLHKPL